MIIAATAPTRVDGLTEKLDDTDLSNNFRIPPLRVPIDVRDS